MAETKIEWTATPRADGTLAPGYTFNPWRGCTKVSSGCANCYAEKLSKRNPKVLGEWGPNGQRVPAAESYFNLPHQWRKAAKKAGERRKVFALSLGDWLDEKAPISFLYGLLSDAIETADALDWLLLTKRLENFRSRLSAVVDYANPDWARRWLAGEPPKNIWLGASVENQAAADERIPILLQIPAAVRFLSIEPLLGPVDLTRCAPYILNDDESNPGVVNALSGMSYHPKTVRVRPEEKGTEHGIQWVIVGGESGPGARPCNLEWIRSLVRQCRAADVPVFVKQLGKEPFEPYSDGEPLSYLMLLDRKGGDWSEWPEELRVREFPGVRP